MRFELLGPDRAVSRMQELQAKIAAAEPKQPTKTAFNDVLQGALGSTLPYNPFGSGTEISSDNRTGGKPSALGADLKEKIANAAKQAGIDVELFDALVQQESSYDPNARSRAGAMGLTQLMPDTAASLGVQNPFDPDQNLRGGAKYLSDMLKKFKDPALALAAYNAGPGRVERAGNQIPDIKETQDYVRKILARYQGSQE